MQDGQLLVHGGIDGEVSLGGLLRLLRVRLDDGGGLPDVGQRLRTFTGCLGSHTQRLYGGYALRQFGGTQRRQLVQVQLVLRHAELVGVAHQLCAGADPSDGTAGHRTAVRLSRLLLCHGNRLNGIVAKQRRVHPCFLGTAGVALGFQLRVVLLAGGVAVDHHLQTQHRGNGAALAGFHVVGNLSVVGLATQTGGHLFFGRTATAAHRCRWVHVSHDVAVLVGHRQPIGQPFLYLFYIYGQAAGSRHIVAIALRLLAEVLRKRPCRQQPEHLSDHAGIVSRCGFLTLCQQREPFAVLFHHLRKVSHPRGLFLCAHFRVKFLCHNHIALIINDL